MPPCSPGQVTVRHESMATDFHLTIAHHDPQYARQAAAEAFQELENIERLLSAHIENSDISRLNRLHAGQSLKVAPHTIDCLTAAVNVEKKTCGAFNVAFASQPRRPTADAVTVTAASSTVRVLHGGVKLGVGGIGKGFALDQMAKLLSDWEIRHFLLRASASTLLAGRPPAGKTGWPIQFGPPGHRYTLELKRSAFSGSGRDIKGNHIIDAKTGRPPKRRRMAWAGAPTATESDALSTAFMVMTPDQIKEYCRRHPDVLAYIQGTGEGSIRRLHEEREVGARERGKWEEENYE